MKRDFSPINIWFQNFSLSVEAHITGEVFTGHCIVYTAKIIIHLSSLDKIINAYECCRVVLLLCSYVCTLTCIFIIADIWLCVCFVK